jgi:hypothetical protein
MGFMKQYQLEQAELEEARLDEEFARECPDLIAEGWDRETYEAFEWASEKDD